jgi:hypothetical protein
VVLLHQRVRPPGGGRGPQGTAATYSSRELGEGLGKEGVGVKGWG